MPVDNIESMPWPDRFNTEVTNNAQFCELFLWLGETLEAVAGTKPAAKAMQALVQQVWAGTQGAIGTRFGEETRALEAGDWRSVVSFPEFYESTLNMIKAQGGIVGWVSTSTELLNAVDGETSAIGESK